MLSNNPLFIEKISGNQLYLRATNGGCHPYPVGFRERSIVPKENMSH